MSRNEKGARKVDFCPYCGKSEVRRDLDSFEPYCCKAEGRNEVCPVCGEVFWVPMNSEEELVRLTDADAILYSLLEDAEKYFGSAEKFLEFVKSQKGEKNETVLVFEL